MKSFCIAFLLLFGVTQAFSQMTNTPIYNVCDRLYVWGVTNVLNGVEHPKLDRYLTEEIRRISYYEIMRNAQKIDSNCNCRAGVIVKADPSMSAIQDIVKRPVIGGNILKGTEYLTSKDIVTLRKKGGYKHILLGELARSSDQTSNNYLFTLSIISIIHKPTLLLQRTLKLANNASDTWINQIKPQLQRMLCTSAITLEQRGVVINKNKSSSKINQATKYTTNKNQSKGYVSQNNIITRLKPFKKNDDLETIRFRERGVTLGEHKEFVKYLKAKVYAKGAKVYVYEVNGTLVDVVKLKIFMDSLINGKDYNRLFKIREVSTKGVAIRFTSN